MAGEAVACFYPTSPATRGSVKANLISLGRLNPLKPNFRCSYNECIAIHYARDAKDYLVFAVVLPGCNARCLFFFEWLRDVGLDGRCGSVKGFYLFLLRGARVSRRAEHRSAGESNQEEWTNVSPQLALAARPCQRNANLS